jgi:hypothetical protein
MHKGSLERVNNFKVFAQKTVIAPYSVESSELHRQGYYHRRNASWTAPKNYWKVP